MLVPFDMKTHNFLQIWDVNLLKKLAFEEIVDIKPILC